MNKLDRDEVKEAVLASMEKIAPAWQLDAIILAERMNETRECAKLIIKLDRLGLTANQISAAIRAKY